MSCLGVKRSAAHFELESPVKRVRQYLKEGYMTYGSAWAEQQFATAVQQGVFSNTTTDVILAESLQQEVPVPQEESMDCDAQRQEEWWRWWSDKWKVQTQCAPDPLGR